MYLRRCSTRSVFSFISLNCISFLSSWNFSSTRSTGGGDGNLFTGCNMFFFFFFFLESDKITQILKNQPNHKYVRQINVDVETGKWCKLELPLWNLSKNLIWSNCFVPDIVLPPVKPALLWDLGFMGFQRVLAIEFSSLRVPSFWWSGVCLN